MSDILSYIQNNPQETQRLSGVKYANQNNYETGDHITYRKATEREEK